MAAHGQVHKSEDSDDTHVEPLLDPLPVSGFALCEATQVHQVSVFLVRLAQNVNFAVNSDIIFLILFCAIKTSPNPRL